MLKQSAKHFFWFFICLTAILVSEKISAAVCAVELADRWFYASFGLNNDADAEELCRLIQTAGRLDLNGMLWACNIENYADWDQHRKERLKKIKKTAEDAHVEIIPILWSVGYGSFLGKNPNLTEGLPVEKKPCVSNGRKLIFAPETPGNLIQNPGFEDFHDHRFAGYDFHDLPGIISFADTDVKHSGNASIRIENFSQNRGYGRITQKISVRPNARYVFSVWYRTEGLEMDGRFRVQIHQKNINSMLETVPVLDIERKKRQDGKNRWGTFYVSQKNGFRSHEVRGQEENGWKQSRIYFQTGPEDTEIRLYLGVWEGSEGKFWLDDLELEEVGIRNPLHRPGAPITVQNVQTGKYYSYGKDFVLPENYRVKIWGEPEAERSVELEIPPGSAIAKGDEVFVSFYEPARTESGQVSVCMSEPELYQRLEESAKGVMEALAPKKWFLSMDEIRAAGTCKACQKRNVSLGEILGDCLTKQYRIIQKYQPGAEVYVWSDMLDPKHNCRADYYACRGDFTGVWDHIPRELIISCWYYDVREDSMKFFSEKGFRVQAAAYYDKDDAPNWNGWLETCRKTPGCTGIMYATWQKKYDLLAPFAQDLKK